MPELIENTKKPVAPMRSAAEPSLRPGSSSHDSPAAGVSPDQAMDKSNSESAFTLAQDLWGAGNLSPLDHLFGSTAIMKLVPKGGISFIGYHLGRRLHRYSEDTAIWIDAFEAEPSVSRFHLKKNSKIKLGKWAGGADLLKKNRYPNAVAIQASSVCPSLETVYRQCAQGLKSTGRLFAADLMFTDSGGGTPQGESIVGPGGQKLLSPAQHKNALAAAGFKIEAEYDLTDGLIAAVRSGFRDSIKLVGELKALEEPQKGERITAFCAQLDTWGRLYTLAQKRLIIAKGFLAAR